MESSMEILIRRRASIDKNFLSFSAPTYAQVRRVFSDWVRAVYRLEVVGADCLPALGPAVVAPNHASVLDGIVLGAAISRELRFVAKAELWQSRLPAWVLDGLDAIRIKRGCSDHLALAQVRQALDAGQAVSIFPQGAVCGDRVWHRGAARTAGAGPPRRHSTGSLAWQNRLPTVARHHRRADRSGACPRRSGRGDGADRAVTRRRRIAGLAGFDTLAPKRSAKEGIRCL